MNTFNLDSFRTERRPIQPESAVIRLPRPPSLNGTQRSTSNGQRYSTKKYKDWQLEACQTIQAQRPRRFTGPVTIEILIEETARISDIDNRIKPLFDALVKMQIIPDDNQKFVRAVSAAWSTEISGAQVTITHARQAA